MQRAYNNTTIETVTGDIANQPDIQAVVNAANATLSGGGGVDGALHRAAGPELAQEASAHAPITPGEAVITGGYELPNDYVIHCLGPVYGRDEPADELLRACYQNALMRAREYAIESVAFPAISAGAFGYPLGDAAQIAVDAVMRSLQDDGTVLHVRFVLFRESDQAVFDNALSQR